MVSGVYRIWNLITGDEYVGSAVDLKRRAGEHVRALVQDRHDNQPLQRAVKKHGIGAFRFEVLELCGPADCTRLEQNWMYYLDPEYNASPTAGSNLGVKRRKASPETRAKLSAAMMGNTHLLGHKTSEETKQRIRKEHLTRRADYQEWGRKGAAAMTPEQRKANARKGGLLRRKQLMEMTPEERTALARKAGLASVAARRRQACSG